MFPLFSDYVTAYANMFSRMSKLAQFVNILAQFVFVRSYFGNKMAHFVSPENTVTNCWHLVSDENKMG